MSWFPQKRQRTWLQRACESVLCAGPIPKHIAIIMDGNRRFATRNSIQKSEGHVKGFDKLAETLEWCLDLGISEVTVYAFSIENFKRSSDEVNGLMELAIEKFKRLLQEKDLIQQHGVCVRIIGDMTLLPKDLQELLAEAVSISANNTRAILNVCFAYTARDDMCKAIKEMAQGVQDGHIQQSDISEDLLEKCLYTAECSNVDLLIRTSGEVRLSDFLLWETSYSCLAFIQVLWPDFSIWHLYAAILHYQRNHNNIQIARQNNVIERQRLQRESDFKCVMEALRLKEANQSSDTTEKLITGSNQSFKSDSIQSKVHEYAAERELRVKNFLDCVHTRRKQLVEEMLPNQPCIVTNPSPSALIV